MKQHDSNVRVRGEVLRLNGLDYGLKWMLVTEKQQSPVMVFLHDALGSNLQWKDFPALLVRKLGLNALLIERQGHGRSSPLSGKRGMDYLRRQAFDVLPGLLTKLGITKLILIGHSDGGTIALLYGSHFDPLAIVSIAAHIFVEDITVSSIREKLPHQDFLQSRLVKYHGDKTEALFRAWSETWIAPEFRAFNIEEELKGITAPTLAIQSKDDEYGTELQLDAIMKNIRSKVKKKCFLESGGHMLHLTRPHALCDKIVKFLNYTDLSDFIAPQI